jgi:hypothetical protein
MADEQIDKLAHDYLTGAAGESHRMDAGLIAGLFRDWEKLKDTPQGDDLAAAIARRLGDPDPELRYRALQFLHGVDTFGATSAVLPFVRGDRSLFRDVYPAEGGDKDLEWWLLRVLNMLIGTIDEARALARKEALDPNGRPGPLMARLAHIDGGWVRGHRDEIERLHPETKAAIVNNLV